MTLGLVHLFAVATLMASAERTIHVRIIPAGAGNGTPCSGVARVYENCAQRPCGLPRKEVQFDGDELRLAVPDSEGLLVEFQAQGCWLPSVNLQGDASEIVVRRWRATTLSGQLDAPRLRDIKRLNATVTVAGADGAESLQDCEVEGANWKCSVPAARFSIVLATPGLAPRHFWDIDGNSGAVSLGSVDFRPGSTISGSVAFESQSELKDAFVELYEEGLGRERALARAPLSGSHFEFSGIAPGVYRVIARAKGASPTRSAPISTTSGSSRDAGQLTLQELSTLKTLVTPSVDDSQRPWRLRLERLDVRTDRTTLVAEELIDPTGWWERSGLESGAYVLSIVDVGGGILRRDRVEVSPGMAPLPVDVQLIPIRGTLAVGGEYFAGDLTFQSTGLSSGKRVSMKSDKDGAFRGHLPHEGTWNVRVQWPDRRTHIIKRGVDVKLRHDAPYAEVDITLAAGKVEGVVIDAEGDGVPEADVMLIRDDAPTGVATPDSDGRFEFLGLEKGANVFLRAMTRVGDSGLVPATADESFDRPVRLVIRKERTISGTLVTSDGRPVAGAALRFAATTSGIPLNVVSGPGGFFELRIPHDTKDMTVTILAIGLPVSLQSSKLTAGIAKLRLTVGTVAGELVVPMTQNSQQPLIGPIGGAPVFMRTLVFPPDGSTTRRGVETGGFRIEIEPGTYQYCALPDRCEAIVIKAGSQTIVNAFERE